MGGERLNQGLGGLGLNPILQDFSLAIHPPILYSGYVGFSLILSLALSGLVTDQINNKWYEYTLYGLKQLDLNAPVCHISYYEAYAYSNWSGCRLPTEQESEIFLKNSIG